MSHVAVVDLEIRPDELDDVALACELIGCELMRGQKTYKWFGSHVGDYCFDDQTSVMTEHQGLVRFSDLQPNESVMTLNLHSGLVEFQSAHVIRNAYSGPLVRLHGKALDMAVTPNHRVLVKRKEYRSDRTATKIVIRDAEWFLGRKCNRYGIPRSGDWTGDEPAAIRVAPVQNHAKALSDRRRAVSMVGSGVSIGATAVAVQRHPSLVAKWVSGRSQERKSGDSIEFETGDWMEFLGWWLSEGSANKAHNYRVYIWQSQSANPEKCARISGLLKRMGIRARSVKGGFEILSRQLYEHLSPIGKSRVKGIPEYAKVMSPQLLQRMIDALLKGDGSEMRRFYTGSTKLRDDFMEVAIKCGYGCTYRIGGDKKTQVWDVGISRRTAYHQITNVSTVTYEGMVYCVSVPNGTVMTSRNGKLSWSGNSIPDGFAVADLGKCDHAIRVKDGTGREYEIGLVERDGKLVPLWDFWMGGYGLMAKVGENCKKLKQALATAKAARAAAKLGYRVQRIEEGTKVRLRLTGGRLR